MLWFWLCWLQVLKGCLVVALCAGYWVSEALCRACFLLKFLASSIAALFTAMFHRGIWWWPLTTSQWISCPVISQMKLVFRATGNSMVLMPLFHLHPLLIFRSEKAASWTECKVSLVDLAGESSRAGPANCSQWQCMAWPGWLGPAEAMRAADWETLPAACGSSWTVSLHEAAVGISACRGL